MSKIVALAFADLHMHKFKNFNVKNSRLKNALKVLKIIGREAKRLEVPVLFCGDLFHNPKEVENETMALAQKYFYKYFYINHVQFIAISGNHDLSEKNSYRFKSPSHLDSFVHYENFNKIDWSSQTYMDFFVYGIPYLNNESELKEWLDKANGLRVKGKLNILLMHSDCPGAVTPLGFEVKETEYIPKDMDKFFKGWDLVLFGHIHKPQRLSDKVYMLGAPLHQDQGDAGIPMGYWEVYDNGVMVHKMLDLPMFIKLQRGQLVGGGDNYYIPYEAVLEEEEAIVGEFSILHSRSKLADSYIALKNIKSKSKRRALKEILNQTE